MSDVTSFNTIEGFQEIIESNSHLIIMIGAVNVVESQQIHETFHKRALSSTLLKYCILDYNEQPDLAHTIIGQIVTLPSFLVYDQTECIDFIVGADQNRLLALLDIYDS